MGVVEILVVLPILVVQILVVGEVGVIIITAMLAYPWKVTICTACFIRYRVNMTFLITFTFPTHAMDAAPVASVHERSLEKLPAISTQVMSNLLIFRRFIFQVIITILGWERVGCSKGDHKLQEVSSASDDRKIKTGTTVVTKCKYNELTIDSHDNYGEEDIVEVICLHVDLIIRWFDLLDVSVLFLSQVYEHIASFRGRVISGKTRTPLPTIDCALSIAINWPRRITRMPNRESSRWRVELLCSKHGHGRYENSQVFCPSSTHAARSLFASAISIKIK